MTTMKQPKLMAIPTSMSGSSPRWLRLFILAMCALRSSSKNIAQISYFSFISLAQNTTGPRSNLVVYTQLLQTDDSPFASIDLPWKFNLLGENINRVFINPNGGLHASPVQPCPPDNYFGNAGCDFRNSYYRAIGGLLTDLNPHSISSANGNITSYRGSDHVTIDYYKIAYYGSARTNNFRIVVYKDSHIEIIYDKIFRNNNFPKDGQWTSGLRGSAGDDFSYFSPEQLNSASTEWGAVANVPGIYPSKASVISGNQFNICPVARVWCASPNIVSRYSSFTANPTEFITFTTTLLSCVNTVQYGAILTSHGFSTPGEKWSIPCAVVHNTTLQCNISTLRNTSIPAGEYDVTPAWRLNHTEPFQTLLVDSLLVTIVNNSLYNSATQSYDPSIGCANNANTTACASCELCQGDYTCLNLPCPSVPPTAVSSSVPVGLSSSVYDRITCSNTCPVFSTNPSDTYFTDFNRTCCAESAMDCSGRCEGVSEVAVDTDGAVICCSPPHKADCAGVCDGTAVLDQCGICEGDGLNCYDPADVTITTFSGGSSFYPVYDITTQNGWQENLLVNVTNRSIYTIKVVFQETPVTLLVNPVLTLPNTTMYVQPYSWINVTISSSIASLVQANFTTWANKQFTAQYERNVTSIPSNEVSLLVYPQVTGCDTLHSARSACLRLPGCIYCFTNPYMRLLRGASTNAAVHDLETNTSLARKLFIELLPPVQGQAENYLYGMCADGYLTKDCSAVAPFYFTSGGHSIELRFGMYFTFLLAIIFNFF